MRISLEAEALPLFAGGVALAALAEVIFVLVLLRKRPEAKRAAAGHVVCLLLAFLSLGYLLFGGRRAPDGGDINGTGLLVLFGIFWFAGEWCVLNALLGAMKGDKGETSQRDSG